MMRNPDDLLISPGVTLGSIKEDREALHAALVTLEADVSDIKAQLDSDIGFHFASGVPTSDPVWRSKATKALANKRTALAIVRATLGAMRRQRQAQAAPQLPRPDREKRTYALLDTFRDELGDAEFERLKDIAKARYPDLFGAGQ